TINARLIADLSARKLTASRLRPSIPYSLRSPECCLQRGAVAQFINRRKTMSTIRAFRAERAPKDMAVLVSAVPYDVVNTEEARKLAAGNPLSFLHVSRPEIDLPDGTDIYSDSVYRKAVENFQNLIKSCPMETENAPSIYLYRLIMGDHEQIGVVACCAVDEYDNAVILKHERTRRDKEDDRTRHMIALG